MSLETVVIVGAGNLGRRHLQGALKVKRALSLRVIDPSQHALDLARAAAKEVTLGHPETQVIFAIDLSDLPIEPNAVIVATSADVRLDVLQNIYKICRPKAILLEKLLFQNMSDYDLANQLLGDDLDKVWVNTARRVMQAHQQIKTFFRGTAITGLSASGGLWGMGTSLIHLVDILDFYQPGPLYDVSTEGLDDEVLQSKRPGFCEITGTLCGRLGQARFTITSSPQSSAPLRLFIEAPDRFCLVEEGTGRIVFGTSGPEAALEEKWVRFDYISDTTTVILSAMLTGKQIELPDFVTSAALHRSLLSALGPYFASRLQTPRTFVPLT